jgi:hypothetical protein
MTAAFRVELMQRRPGEVLYDECLIGEMRKGKSFRVALQTANAAFPTEALEADTQLLAEAEAHYRFHLDMEQTDQLCQQLKEYDRRIEEKSKRPSGCRSG